MRRAAAVAVVLLVLHPGAPRAAPGPAPPDVRARRAEVLVQAAHLTDRVEKAQAGVVAAQLHQARADDALATTRSLVRARAVNAYVHATGEAAATLAAPRPYLEVAAAKQRQLLAGHRRAAAEAAGHRRRAEAAHQELARAGVELAQVQAALEAAVAAEDAAQAEERRRADAARHAALASRSAALATARGEGLSGPPAPSASSAGYAPSPLDPHALLPRHREATRRQLSLMARVPFGPLAPGAGLPAGLVPTGHQVVGTASWYGPGFNGRPTASGAIYDQEAWTVASRDLPLGTFLVVSRADRRVLLLVNDRGPYVDGRVLDLSAAAARHLGIGGVAPVVADVVRTA